MVVDLTYPNAGSLRHCAPAQYPCSADAAVPFTCSRAPHCFSFAWDAVTTGPSGVANVTLTLKLSNNSATATVLLRTAFTDVTTQQVQQCLAPGVALANGAHVIAVLNVTSAAQLTSTYTQNVTVDYTGPVAPSGAPAVVNGPTSTHTAYWRFPTNASVYIRPFTGEGGVWDFVFCVCICGSCCGW